MEALAELKMRGVPCISESRRNSLFARMATFRMRGKPFQKNIAHGSELERVKIEFLYFEGCPSYKKALERLRAVLKEFSLDTPIEMIQVNTEEEALQTRFLGSPSIRIDGVDAEKTARNNTEFGLTCRIYQTPDGPDGSMTMETLREAISEALSSMRNERSMESSHD